MNYCMICDEPIPHEGDICSKCNEIYNEYPIWEEYFEEEENEIRRV